MGAHHSKEWLYSAIEAENIELINKILYKKPYWVNQPMTKDCQTTPLSRAVWRGATKIVEELLKLGADVNYAGPTGVTPLMWAAKRGKIEILIFLIENQADIQTLSPEGFFNSKGQFLQNLIQKGFNCFDWAIIHGQYTTAQYLMNNYKQFKFQSLENYQLYQNCHSLPYINYDIMIENLQNNTDAALVPNYHQKPQKEEVVFTDPVIDPNETWKQYFKRVMNFEEPPLIERSDLPLKQQPQNRILGKLNSYWNGRNPYPKKSNTLKEENMQQSQYQPPKQQFQQVANICAKEREKENQEADSLMYDIEL